jgi:hypothetical protein
MSIDYKIKIPCTIEKERAGCDYCEHGNDCQYKVEIFDEHTCYKHLIRHRKLTDWVGMLCKYFEIRTI